MRELRDRALRWTLGLSITTAYVWGLANPVDPLLAVLRLPLIVLFGQMMGLWWVCAAVGPEMVPAVLYRWWTTIRKVIFGKPRRSEHG